MGCGCNRARSTTGGAGATAAAVGTYRVMVGDRKVYESSSETAAKTVAGRFGDAKILAPGEQ